MTSPPPVSPSRAVYDATAEFYSRAVGTEVSAAFERPIDLAVLASFADLVAVGRDGVVIDVGCGTGRVAASLAARGLDVVGVDQSNAMLTVARDAHGRIPFVQGVLDALPHRDRSVIGVVCWYSIIHTPPDQLVGALAELARILDRGAPLLVAFQAGGGERVQRPDAYGTGLTLDGYRHSPEEVARQLAAADFDVHTRVLRGPELSHESAPQAFIVARRRP